MPNIRTAAVPYIIGIIAFIRCFFNRFAMSVYQFQKFLPCGHETCKEITDEDRSEESRFLFN